MSKLDRVLVLHGPNLNLLGRREPEVYGHQTLAQIDADLSARAKELEIEIECYQSNHEGELVDRIQDAMGQFGGILINPAGFTHSSVALRDALESENIPYEVDEGGGAFYGPKIDIKIRDAIGREWQMSTIQFDFNLPERFDLNYTGSDGKNHRPYMIHRALFGSLERFFGVLIEHYGGRFPVWLAPVQVALIPIREEHAEYMRECARALQNEGIRVDCMDHPAHMNKKIKQARREKVPFLLIAGDREVETKSVTVSQRGKEEQGSSSLTDFIERIKALRDTRSLSLDE